jgi:F-type H+-transporting ATPase subunit delta
MGPGTGETDMRNSFVARRYAQALYEVSREKDCIADTLRDMDYIRGICDHAPAVRRYCMDKKKVQHEELEFINITFVPYVTGLTGRVLAILVKNDRLFSLPFLPPAFEDIYNEHEHIVSVTVESAHELTQKVIAGITHQMEQRTGKRVKLRTVLIPELLGGFRVVWNNRILDFTARSRLSRLRRFMSGPLQQGE